MGLYRELRRDAHPLVDETTVEVYASRAAATDAGAVRELPAPDAPRPAVSLVASVRNERATVESWLASLLAQARPADEIVIVDGGSTDGTLEALEAFAARCPVPTAVRQEANVNIARGRNLAIERARGPIIACTDAGCELSPGWLAAITGPFAREPATEVVAGYYEAICRTDLQRAMAAYFAPPAALLEARHFLPSGRSVAFRKDVWAAVGGFPEWLTLAGEDTLFDVALKRRRARWAFVPEASVGWHPRETIVELFRQVRAHARGDGEAGLFPDRYLRHIRRAAGAALAALLAIACAVGAAATGRSVWWLGAAAALAGLAGQIRRTTLQPAPRSPLAWPKAFALSAAVSYTIVLAQAIGFVQGVRLRMTRDDAKRCADAHRD